MRYDILFETLAREAPTGIFVTDSKGECVFVNKLWCELAGMSIKEALGQGWSNALHPDDREKVSKEWYDSVAQGREFCCEYRFQRSDGKIHWLAGRASSVRGTDGETSYFIGTIIDITTQRKEREQLISSSRLLESIIENIPNMIFLKQAKDLRFVMFNRAGEELLGVSRVDLMGKNDFDFFPKEQAEFFIKKDREVLESGQFLDIAEEPIETKQHGRRYLHTKKIPLKDTNGNPSFLLGISEDITDRREAQVVKERALQAAKEANALKSQFLANMSHEIRTPMNGIIGLTELLLDSNLSEIQHDYLSTVRGCATSLLEVINDILDFSKIEAGKLEIHNVTFSPKEELRALELLFSRKVTEKQINATYKIDPNLPEYLLGDSLRLRQILINLIGNAVKFTNDCGSVNVELNYSVSQQNLSVSVSDNGIGIPSDKQHLIFEAFSQADPSHTRAYGGTGLGLTICSSLVQLLGGELRLQSEVGRGSKFSFTIPMRGTVGHVTSPERLLEKINTDVSDCPEKLRILLGEDNAVNQKLASALLTRAGHLVTVASSGREALRLFSMHEFDMILMDIQMPELDGFETTRLIRQTQAGLKIPIIAMTAHVMEGDKERCLASGMNDYVSKPIDRKVLLETIKRSWRSTRT